MPQPWFARATAFSHRLPGPEWPKDDFFSLVYDSPESLAYATWVQTLIDADYVRGPHLGEVQEASSRSRRGSNYTFKYRHCCGQSEGAQVCRRVPFRHHTGTINGGGSRRSGGAHQYHWSCCWKEPKAVGCTPGPHPRWPLPIEVEIPEEIPEEIRQRDRVLRAYILGRTWDTGEEFGLVRQFLQEDERRQSRPWYLYDYEWEAVPGRSHLGRGDLVLTDGQGAFIIVEVKWLSDETGKTARVRRTTKRKKVVEQAIEYAQTFASLHPEARVILPCTYTNVGGEGQLRRLKEHVIRQRRSA